MQAYGRDKARIARLIPGMMAGVRHVLDGLGIDVGEDADLIFKLVQLCAGATSKPLTDDELRLIAAYPRELSLLYPGLLS